MKLKQDFNRLQKELEEKTSEIGDLKKKDRINRCQELEVELGCYIEETVRLREIIINLSSENGRLREL
jgi:hypothetical protein